MTLICICRLVVWPVARGSLKCSVAKLIELNCPIARTDNGCVALVVVVVVVAEDHHRASARAMHQVARGNPRICAAKQTVYFECD